MFAQKGDYDTESRLDCGPAAAGEGKAPPMDLLLVNGLNHHSMDTCTQSPVSVLSSDLHAADSSIPYEEDSDQFQSYVKSDSDNNLNHIDDDIEPSEHSNQVSNLLSIEEGEERDTSNRVSDLISIEEGSEQPRCNSSNQFSAQEATTENTTLFSNSLKDDAHNGQLESGSDDAWEPVESIPKLTLNVGSAVGNITAIQNVVQSVSSGNQTLWLPTIISSNASSINEDAGIQNEMEGPSTTVSQIILASSGQHFTTPLLSSPNSSNAVSHHKYSPKVQILSSITIPKHGSITSNMKGVIHTNYLSPNDISKLNTGTSAQNSKQLVHNSVLNNKLSSKGSASNSCGSGRMQGGHGNTRGASVTTSGGFQMKSATNKPANKSNNGLANSKPNSNPLSTGNTHSHVLSRVVPGPKMSLQSMGRGLKTNSSFQYSQKVSNRSGSFPNIVQSQNIHSPMPVKIVQQQNTPTHIKGGLKTLPPSRTGIGSKGSHHLHAKSWSTGSTNYFNQANIKKSTNYPKNLSASIGIQNSKNTSQRLMLQQASSQMISSYSAQKSRTNYFQPSNGADNSVRYIQSYLGIESNQNSVSSNQNLTAQILQSLSHPKGHHTFSQQSSQPSVDARRLSRHNHSHTMDQRDQWKQLHGDPSTLLLSDDIPGTEERPNLSDDSLSYHYYTLQLVMLDHNYAGTPQATNSTTSSAVTVAISNTSPINNSSIISPLNSPIKPTSITLSSPVNCSLSNQSPIYTTGTLTGPTIGCLVQSSYQYSSLLPQEKDDDDAASVISSIDGDERRQTERNGSDTETAPEGEEEGKTRCVCDFTHDDGYMICCDRCGEWQHVDCMAIDRQNIPDDYMCEKCQPRLVDRKRARSIQMRKREELTGLGSSGSESSSISFNVQRNKKLIIGGVPQGPQKKRPLTVTTYSNTVGGISRAVPTLPPHPSPLYSLPAAVVPVTAGNTKRGSKRPRRVDNGRKGPKRKIPEKKMKRKSDIAKYRNKYFSPPNSIQVNQMNESYELATTNHYSPELRAKIARYYSNKAISNPSAMSVVLTAHNCTTVPHAGAKILIATKDMKENTPIIELRGKYMLSTQHRPQAHPAPRAGSQRPGPYLFFYRFPKDSTQVCIDTRTYGNEARFVRRSCKPNAELQHCIVKGALHVYLVTINSVQSNTEISIGHESSGSWQPCACGNPNHCKQTSPGSALSHRNNGATSERDRRGRTRHSSSSAPFSPPSASMAMPKENISPKLSSPKKLSTLKMDKRRRSEQDSALNVVVKQEIEDKTSAFLIKREEINIEPKIEAILDLKPLIENELSVSIKEELITVVEMDLAKIIKEEVKKEKDLSPVSSPVKVQIIPKSPETVSELTEVVKSEPVFLTESDASELVETISQFIPKELEKPKDSIISNRRTSTHSTRTTRASVAATAGESGDEKSDSQSESKPQSTKDKKKMTREERKMEAIVKAFERMEKAEQRKLENRDKQTKRRESDPQQSCSVTSTSDCKESSNQQSEESMLKGRPRRKGRARTASQNSSNRLNSVDSDMLTSEEEQASLMSPPRSTAPPAVLDHFTPEDTFRELAETNIALGESINRMKAGLSSACLLVEAAVGPLETTFKFPKTKKAIMNEWLNQSPESHTSYDLSASAEYSSLTESDRFLEKQTFLGRKSIENLVKVANTMIGTLSGGTISADSSPEKSQQESEAAVCADLSCSRSPSPVELRRGKRAARELSMASKRPRRGGKLEAGSTKRSLRSATCAVPPPRSPDPPAAPYLPPPPQHSAKKRWLRQAISEESDSPTTESPPSEMVTPLKKRRLARESLSQEPVTCNNNEDAQYRLLGTPTKENREILFPLNSLSEKPLLPIMMASFQSDKNLTQDFTKNQIEKATPELITEEVPTVISETKLDSCNNNEDLPICLEYFTKAEREDSSLPTDAEIVHSENSNHILENIPCVQGAVETSVTNDETIDKVYGDTKSECTSIINSTETSGNSSPVLDEMDDIQKKIHSFHTENIQILKIRNKKAPKEKRKKVNLNFDLSVLDDQTVEVKLTSELDTLEEQMEDGILKSDVGGFGEDQAQENKLISQVSVLQENYASGSKLQSDEVIEPTVDGKICEKELTADLDSKEKQKEISPTIFPSISPVNSNLDHSSDRDDSGIFRNSEDISQHQPALKKDLNFIELTNNNFPSANLFAGSYHMKTFAEKSPDLNEDSPSIPDLNVIKNAIDMTASLESSVFKDGTVLNPVDEYKNVQEILSHVNQMDSRNSVLLSGVLKDTNQGIGSEAITPTKLSSGRSNDPRLNPPPTETPKPVRRKLSISEYRRRYSMANPSESGSPPSTPGDMTDMADEEDISRLEKNLEDTINTLSVLSDISIGVYNAQPSVIGRQTEREKLSDRLRREFGLSLPEDEEARAATLQGESEGGEEASLKDDRTEAAAAALHPLVQSPD